MADSNAVRELIEGVAHRGPDDRGLWSSRTGACTLGHARLSILDLSSAGHQPMIDRHTGSAIAFNGEIYNFQELRAACRSEGDQFSSGSDTEVILALYRRHYVDCLKLLRGMFALAIWDETRQELFLARDRVGKKPLHYALSGSGIVFCSELTPLSHHPLVDSTTDYEALELYLQCQYIPSPWTIYQGIRKLPPAHFAVHDRNGLRIEKYWDVDYRNKFDITESDAVDALEEKLTEATRIRMIADVPVGALLSGGVDSSVVVALMSKLAAEPVLTFSIGFEEESFNELPWAQAVADQFATAHRPEIVSADVEHLLPQLVRHYGEPFADSSAIPSFVVSRTARQHVKVVLNGDGGDELLGGYPRYRLPGAALVTSGLLSDLTPRRRMVKTTGQFLPARSLPGRATRRLLMRYVNPELQSLLGSAFWNDPQRRALFPDGPPGLLDEWRVQWFERAFDHADNPVDRMLWLDNQSYLQDDLLVKMDIASMHCGLETRSPLLDHKVIEFCARLPVEMKVNRGIGKYLLKKLASRHFPDSFVNRRKMGFGVPLETWLRGPLREVLMDTLGSPQLMAPLSTGVVSATLKEFAKGKGAHESRLWALLMFGLWQSIRQPVKC